MDVSRLPRHAGDPRCCVCKPADPEAKGLVERANGYLETCFLPGRTFTSPADFNVQLGAWLALANTRNTAGWVAPRPTGSPRTGPRCWRCRRSRRSIGWRSTIRLARDHYVRSGQQRLLGASRSDRPPGRGGRGPGPGRVMCEGNTVADRHDGCWARHQTISDPSTPPPRADARTAAHRRGERSAPADYDTAPVAIWASPTTTALCRRGSTVEVA